MSSWVLRVLHTGVLCCASHSGRQPTCLLRKSSSISRKVSGPAVDAVWSAQTQIWPYSSLLWLPKSTVTPWSPQTQAKSLEFNPLHQLLQEWVPFSFARTAPGSPVWFWAHLCLWLPLGALSLPRHKGLKTVAY